MPKGTKSELKTVQILRKNCRKSGVKTAEKQAQKRQKLLKKAGTRVGKNAYKYERNVNKKCKV